jgi:hypothetical protein
MFIGSCVLVTQARPNLIGILLDCAYWSLKQGWNIFLGFIWPYVLFIFSAIYLAAFLSPTSSISRYAARSKTIKRKKLMKASDPMFVPLVHIAPVQNDPFNHHPSYLGAMLL